MQLITNLQSSFDSTLTDSNFQNLGIDLAEIGIDSILNQGLLKEIPIVSTIANLSKVGANIHDRLFLKKVLSFLNQMKSVSVDKRKEMIDKIDSSSKYRIKVGEKLLYIIDSCEDYEISELVSIVFKSYIQEKISYDDFLKVSTILSKINKSDFDWFVAERKNHSFDLDDVGDLISSGLFELHYEKVSVSVEDESDYDLLQEGKKYNTDVDGGDISVSLSGAGKVILEIFCTSYQKSK
ncbi:MAG: hypothetical protein COV91_05030 [Candidatus Taylorbacteria bacterium CG11_big_fil_rev_8_21_14_0_20_46_11]|uniref:Uncharacterized protein n=1 Tax=Candidatus Taylorbacteria bacterium CG11_big_fil_rev_8_21_14_0_20_46_11 TaxID=1975025 RepID=A0A2H0KCE2_9BACT|nr:MAG: hypothetical protein COV91_05030 [Candidatus Taylorbacteria bacterium CG11_big_fil_rev_8_21_14_0_20_46_11]